MQSRIAKQSKKGLNMQDIYFSFETEIELASLNNGKAIVYLLETDAGKDCFFEHCAKVTVSVQYVIGDHSVGEDDYLDCSIQLNNGMDILFDLETEAREKIDSEAEAYLRENYFTIMEANKPDMTYGL